MIKEEVVLTQESVKMSLREYKNYLEDNVAPFLSCKNRRNRGHFVVLSALLAMIDLLAFIWENPKGLAENNAAPLVSVKFIREILGQINSRYAEFGALLYLWFRHPTVYQSYPRYCLELDRGVSLTWETSKYPLGHKVKTNKHLDIYKVPNTDNLWRLHVDVTQFYRDMAPAIDIMIDMVREDSSFAENAGKAMEIISKSVTEQDLLEQRKNYNINKDIECVKNIIFEPRKVDSAA